MKELTDIKQYYINQFNEFENSLNGESTSEIHLIRRDAIKKFQSLPIPNQKDEEWKYTNISPLFDHQFSPAKPSNEVSGNQITKFLFDQLEHSLLVFVNGYYSQELSKIERIPEGVFIGSLADAISDGNSIVKKHLGKYVNSNNQIFTSLSTAFIKDGAFIYVPKNIIVDKPIHIIYLTESKGNKILTQPRNLFVADKNSQITIIEHYVSEDNGVYFTNSITEVFNGENAVLDHIKLQEESKQSFHIATMEVDQERNSNFSSHLISYGARISRNDFTTRFNDEGGMSMLNGLFMINEDQLFDAHTMIDHAKPHCNSHEHYKGILQDKSRGVFNGKVMVRKDAQKTNAFQENNTIILSDEALMNTKPQLEIFADDVKCSHGATIGKLNDEAKFYLKSRGIGEDAATAMLIHAFASDVIKSIKIEAVRDYLEEIITKKFNG